MGSPEPTHLATIFPANVAAQPSGHDQFMSTRQKCGMVPLRGTPNVAWSGLAFSQATNCLKSLTSAGTAVPTKTQNSNRVSWPTGTKSLAASKLGAVSTIGSRYIVGPVVTRMVVPSGLA